MNICIAGKNRIAIDSAAFLLEHYSEHRVFGCKNGSDDGIDGWQPSFAKFCKRRQIPLIDLENLYGMADLLFVALEYERLIKPERFASSRLFNMHFSKLPAYKGMFTSAFPLLFGEKESGVTLHQIDRGIDTGDIVAQRAFQLPPDMTARELYGVYLNEGLALFKDSISSLIEGKFDLTPQTASGSSYYSRSSLNYSNLRIDLNKTAQEIHNQIRAFAFREYQLPLVHNQLIYKSEIIETRATGKSGTIARQDDFSMEIETIDYRLKLYLDRQSELMRCAETGDCGAYRKLQSGGYPVKTRNDRGWDALIVSCYHNQAAFITELLEDGWDVNSSNYQGTPAVMYAFTAAIRDGSAGALRAVCRGGADLAMRDRYGKTVFDYAQHSGSCEIMDILGKNQVHL